MKLLVLAQIPPPVHGQSVMVRTLVEGLGEIAPDIKILHVNLALSRDAADIGRARIGKIFALWVACWRALWLRARHGGKMSLYYVPAPGKRAALYRDWMVMCALRPFFTRLVLHWHAVGLGAWLATKACAPERWLTQLFLGRAALSIVLAPELADDARLLAPRKISVVAGGVDVFQNTPAQGGAASRRPTRGNAARPLAKDFSNSESPPASVRDSVPSSGETPPLPAQACSPTHLLFLATCTREKGLFAVLDALAILQRETPGAFQLTVAGAFANANEGRDFHARLAETKLCDCVRTIGQVHGDRKHALYADADVFVFPTHYAHEAQPLVLMEALSHDLPIVTTRWRAIPGMLPDGCAAVQLVEPHASPETLATAIRAARDAESPRGALRAHYEKYFTREAHLRVLARALRSE